jgi:hypothetical protein
MEREAWQKRPGVRVWWKSKDCRRETRRRIGKLTGLFEAVHRFFYAKNDVLLSRFSLLYEGKKREVRQDFGEKKVSIDFDELVLGERGEIQGKINRAKERVRRQQS